MCHLLVANFVVLLVIGVGDVAEEGAEGFLSECFTVVEIAENMGDTCHAEEVVELEHLVALQVLLQRAVNYVGRLAVRSEKVTAELALSDFLVERCREVFVQFADLVVLTPAFVV